MEGTSARHDVSSTRSRGERRREARRKGMGSRGGRGLYNKIQGRGVERSTFEEDQHLRRRRLSKVGERGRVEKGKMEGAGKGS